MVRLYRAVVAAGLSLAVSGGVAAQVGPGMADCDAMARDAPQDAGSYGCYIDAANLANDMAGAQRRLEALLAFRPEQHWARYFVGMAIAEQQDYDRGLTQMIVAAEGLEVDGVNDGAAQARVKVALYLTNLRRYDEAIAQLDLAESLARGTDDPGVVARVLVQRGWTALRSGDYTGAALHMRRAEQLVFPQGDVAAQELVLGGRGALAWLTGRFAEAARLYERQAVLLAQTDRIYDLAIAKSNVLGVTSALADRGKVAFGEYERVARDALAASEAAGSFRSKCRAEMALAKILPGEAGRAYARAAVTSARMSGQPLTVRGTLRETAALLATAGPDSLDEALAMLAEAAPAPYGNPDERIRQLQLAAVVWRRAGTHDDTVRAYERLFDEAERLRDLQRDDEARAGALAMVVQSYRLLAAYLISRETAPSPEDLDLAFRTLERMRSRVLLDRLDASGVVGATAPEGPLAEQRLALLDEISQVQRELGDVSLKDDRRTELLRELERLEIEERDARTVLAAANPRFGALRLPEFPGTDEIARTLANDQALLSFLSGNAQLGSWVIVVDRRGSRVHRLPEVESLRRHVSFLLGLTGRRDGSERAAALRLGDAVLGEAIAGLDPAVRRLVIVPDQLLWSVPLDLLRTGEDPRPLAGRFEISLAPSAAIWTRWVSRDPDPFPIPALALADPDLPGSSEDGSLRGLTLGRLPHARDEARELTRRLGGGSRMWLAGEASEAALKRESLAEYGLLHLAAHAVVDDEKPDRSAIVLFPGAAEQDGLLQPREIVGLDLDGQVVLLTACRSASGSLIEGEGPLSLARAFFQAGAHAVVGSLWPLRDDDTARLMDVFSRRLAAGASVSEALAGARRKMIADGAPAEAWAGLVLIGDGSAVPVPGGGTSPLEWLTVTLAGAAILAVLVTLSLMGRGTESRVRRSEPVQRR